MAKPSTKNHQWVVIVYGIADRKIRSVHVRDDDAGLEKVKPRPGEALIRVPRSRYQTFSSGTLAQLIP